MCWKRSFHNNPNGDIDVARIDSLKDWEPVIARMVERQRGHAVTEEPFTYYLAPKAIWVKRVETRLFREGGMSVFNIPHESGRKKTAANRS